MIGRGEVSGMATAGKREAIDAQFKAWEERIEALRVQVARMPEEEERRFHPILVELARLKEVAKSRWERVRGAPWVPAEERRLFEESYAALEQAMQGAPQLPAEGGAGKGGRG